MAPYNRFMEFIAPQADRYAILASMLDKAELNSLVLPISGNRHFFIFPKGNPVKPGDGAGFPFRGQSPIILAAHYDRVGGSPGANDNSAAVFHLLETAQRLYKEGTGYWIIIFTDKEELEQGEPLTDQGSYTLGETLRQGGLADARVYIFDACGTGDTLVISTVTDYLLKNDESPGSRKARQLIQDLRNHALETSGDLRMSKVLLAPTPFSDDAGFLRSGIPAQTITVLPTSEAAPFASLLRNRPDFADALISREVRRSADRMLIPETWRSLNGPSDSHLRLTPEFYDRIIRFAVALCRE
jgi:hypothetical protein